MKHAESIAWQDVVGEVSIHFCADDWTLVRELVLEMGLNPLSRCNVAYASFDLREESEALLNATRDEPDHAPIERRMREESEAVRSDPAAYERRGRVEARIVGFPLRTDRVPPPSELPSARSAGAKRRPADLYRLELTA